jgi:hypothetical protein
VAGAVEGTLGHLRGLAESLLMTGSLASQLDRRSYNEQALMRVVVWSRQRLR